MAFVSLWLKQVLLELRVDIINAQIDNGPFPINSNELILYGEFTTS